MTRSVDVLFYVQHLLGIGHIRRAAAIARGMTRAGLRVVFVTGGAPVANLDTGGAEVVQLSPARVADESFQLLDADGQPVDEAWRAARRDRLLALHRETRPAVLLIELFPFGRRQMRFELLPLLEAARQGSPRTVIGCSLRDVLNASRDLGKTTWMIETFRRYFDLLIVHGDPRVLPLDRSFPAAAELARQIRYSGYVVESAAPLPDRGTEGPGAGEVIVSTGGGAVGGPLIAAALAARPLSSLHDAPWRILAGQNLDARSFEAFRTTAPAEFIVERSRSDFRNLLARCRLSVSQAGYNTVMDLLQTGCPAVVVPFAAAGETEQSLRAAVFAERKLLTAVPESGLCGASLAAGIDAALALAADRRAGEAGIDQRGTEKTAAILRESLAGMPS